MAEARPGSCRDGRRRVRLRLDLLVRPRPDAESTQVDRVGAGAVVPEPERALLGPRVHAEEPDVVRVVDPEGADHGLVVGVVPGALVAVEAPLDGAVGG